MSMVAVVPTDAIGRYLLMAVVRDSGEMQVEFPTGVCLSAS